MGKLKDKKTVDELWHQHEAYVRKICNYKLASMSDLIDDCVQDVFLALCTAVSNGEEIKNPRAWLTIVANNKIKDLYKKHSKEKQTQFIEETAEAVFDIDEEIERLSESQIDAIKDKVLCELTFDEKLLLKKRYTLKMSAEEIAAEQKTTSNNIYQKLFRLKIKVKMLITKALNT